MTEALKTDWLEQAKREIAEENPLYSAWGPTAMASSISMWRDALVAERARNLELCERIEKLKTAANAWKGSSDGWDSWG